MPCNPLFGEEVLDFVCDRPLYAFHAVPIMLAALANFGKLLRVYLMGVPERFLYAIQDS